MSELKRAAQQVGSLVSRLMMCPDHSGQAAVVVEGSKDHAFYRRILFTEQPGVLLDAGGRKYAIRVAKTVSQQGIPVLAIVDSDNDLAHPNRRDHGESVFTTDRRDMESTMFLSRAGDNLLVDVLDPIAVKNLEAHRGMPVKQLIVEACAYVGALRAVNEFDNLHIRLRDEDPAHHLDASLIAFDEEAYLNAVLVGANLDESPRSVDARVRDVLARVPHEDLVPGHDLTAMLAAVCRGRLGGPGNHDKEALEMALRVAYSEEEFRQTHLYRSLRAWGDEKGLRICA